MNRLFSSIKSRTSMKNMCSATEDSNKATSQSK